MQKKFAKFGATFATLSLVATLVSPVALAADLEITDNGADSTNTIKVETTNATVIGQSNDSEITTAAFSKASTGGNTANNNTGGDVTVQSGDATATTTVTITGSSNIATVEPCGCDSTVPDMKIDNNGTGSTNKIKYKKTNTTVVGQGNLSFVGTLAVSKAKTGKNKANNNTGGSVTVTSGSAVDTTAVVVTGSSNTLNP